MIRLHHFAPLVAVGAVLALTSGAQAQLDDGMPTNPFPGTIINLPADGNPAGDVGDATGAMLTQLNMEAGFNFATGRTEDMGPRTYSFTEVNVFVENGDRTTSANSNAVYNNCEINLMDGFLGNNAIIDSNSTLNVTGGETRTNVEIAGVANVTAGGLGNPVINGTVNISGTGQIFGSAANLSNGGVVNASAGIIFGPFNVGTGGTLNASGTVDLRAIMVDGVANLSGGTINSNITVASGGVVNFLDGVSPGSGTTTINDGGVINLTGGRIGSNTFVESGGVLNASGGLFGTRYSTAPGLNVLSGGTVNFTGTEFMFDGAPMELTPGMPFTVEERDGMLSGTLLTGEQFSFDLSGTNQGNFFNFFAADSTVTVLLEPDVLLGDVNLDGMVNFLDISPFILRLSNQEFQAEADLNQDGAVSFLDISPFILVLTAEAS